MFCYIRYNSCLMWMADVTAIVANVFATIAICFIVVDVIATCWLMLLPSMWWLICCQICDGCCYCHLWQMEWPLYVIMKNIILQTPSKPGVLPRKTFSYTPDEARSVGLAKACVFFFSKNLFCYREIRFKNIIKTEWEIYMSSSFDFFSSIVTHRTKDVHDEHNTCALRKYSRTDQHE